MRAISQDRTYAITTNTEPKPNEEALVLEISEKEVVVDCTAGQDIITITMC